MRSVLVACLAWQVLAGTPGDADPFALFRPTAVVSPAELQQLDRGEPLVKILPAGGQELAALAAVAIAPDQAAGRAAGWVRRVDDLRASRYVLAAGRFSIPPRIADLDGLELDEDDLQDIRRCRPQQCGVKLTEAEIEELRTVAATAGEAWRPAVQLAFRRVVMRRVDAYLAGGLGALAPYGNRKRPRVPADAFAAIVSHSSFLQQQLPDAVPALTECPGRSIAGGDGFLYWSTERLGGKPITTVTHVGLLRPGGDARSDLVAIGVQVFATHYIDASIGVTAIVEGSGGRRYLAYMNRSDVDVLGGFWGGLTRAIIEARVRRDGARVLREVASRIGSSDAPSGERPPLQRSESANQVAGTPHAGNRTTNGNHQQRGTS